MEVQQCIRDYHAIMYAATYAAVVINPDYDTLFVYVNDPRDAMKSDNGEYYGSDKDVDVNEVFE